MFYNIRISLYNLITKASPTIRNNDRLSCRNYHQFATDTRILRSDLYPPRSIPRLSWGYKHELQLSEPKDDRPSRRPHLRWLVPANIVLKGGYRRHIERRVQTNPVPVLSQPHKQRRTGVRRRVLMGILLHPAHHLLGPITRHLLLDQAAQEQALRIQHPRKPQDLQVQSRIQPKRS